MERISDGCQFLFYKRPSICPLDIQSSDIGRRSPVVRWCEWSDSRAAYRRTPSPPDLSRTVTPRTSWQPRVRCWPRPGRWRTGALACSPPEIVLPQTFSTRLEWTASMYNTRVKTLTMMIGIINNVIILTIKYVWPSFQLLLREPLGSGVLRGYAKRPLSKDLIALWGWSDLF